MAPGRVRRILAREMGSVKSIQRHFSVVRSRYQPSRTEEAGAGRGHVAVSLRSFFAGGFIPSQGSQNNQCSSSAPFDRRPLGDPLSGTRSTHTKKRTA